MCATGFIALFTLLWRCGARPAVSPRYARVLQWGVGGKAVELRLDGISGGVFHGIRGS